MVTMKRMTIWSTCQSCGLETAQPQRHVSQTGHTEYIVTRWDEPYSYRSAHRLVYAVRGQARGVLTCACGNPADGWSLKADLHVFGEMRWSPDPNDYDALCMLCHKRRDWPTKEWKANAIAARRIAGRRGAEALKKRREEDPELDAKIRETIRSNGKRVTNDPEHLKKMEEGLRKKREDPEFEAQYRDSRRAGGAASHAGCGGRR